MPGRIEEYDLLAFEGDLIGAYMLCYTSRLRLRDLCFSDRIEQRRLSVIDMSHNGYYRGTGKENRCVLYCIFEERLLFHRSDFQLRAEPIRDEKRRIDIDRLVYRRHIAEIH